MRNSTLIPSTAPLVNVPLFFKNEIKITVVILRQKRKNIRNLGKKMTALPLYGLDKELAEKAAAKFNPQRQDEAREWIEHVTGESFSSADFHEALKDGVLLCK